MKVDQKVSIYHVKDWTSKHHKFLVLFFLLITFILIDSFRTYLTSSNRQNLEQTIINNSNGSVSEVLLIYVYGDTHSDAYGNLKYFIDHAVKENDGVDYYFILQQIDNKIVNESSLPLLPKGNGHYIQHENKCLYFGTIGWFLNEFTYGNPWIKQNFLTKYKNTGRINLNSYKYFIFLNSSIRGPFFPPYFIQSVLERKKTSYWYSVFTRRLNKNVKLVGSTISCETVPHVQSYFLTTDKIGLSILLKPGKWGSTSNEEIFGCYSSEDHVLINSEIPSSNRILQSGYLIDSLLTKYQNLNFSESHNQFCNENNNPYKDKGLEGTSLEPYEVVFFKFNQLESSKDGRHRAKLYQRWDQQANITNRTLW